MHQDGLLEVDQMPKSPTHIVKSAYTLSARVRGVMRPMSASIRILHFPRAQLLSARQALNRAVSVLERCVEPINTASVVSNVGKEPEAILWHSRKLKEGNIAHSSSPIKRSTRERQDEHGQHDQRHISRPYLCVVTVGTEFITTKMKQDFVRLMLLKF